MENKILCRKSNKGVNPVNRSKIRHLWYPIVSFLETILNFKVEAAIFKKLKSTMFAVMILVMASVSVMAAPVNTTDDSWVDTFKEPISAVQKVISWISPDILKLAVLFLFLAILVFLISRFFAAPAQTKEDWAENLRTNIIVPVLMILDKISIVIIAIFVLAIFKYTLF